MIDALVRVLTDEDVPPPGPVPAGVAIRRGRLIPVLGGWFAGMGRPAAAVTLGRTIVVHPSIVPGPRLLRHEIAHVRQWQRYGPLRFAARYIWNHLRYGYEANPFEIQARDAE